MWLILEEKGVNDRLGGRVRGATLPAVWFKGIFGISFLRVSINTLLCNPNLIHSKNPLFPIPMDVGN